MSNTYSQINTIHFSAYIYIAIQRVTQEKVNGMGLAYYAGN